jgi:thiol-disulfide isomerase/thioredoxin
MGRRNRASYWQLGAVLRVVSAVVALFALVAVVRAAEPKAPAAEDETAADPFPKKQKAPSLDGGTEWLNVGEPLDLKQLRGKVVLLDFWTYCCINCMHVLPVLKQIEHKYPNNVVVIGVHSAKFDGERDSQNIRDAILRYEIEHPVVNDAEMQIWNKYFVSSWPSLRLIDPEGNLIAGHSGEVDFETLDGFISKTLDHYRKQGLLNERPLRFSRESEKGEETALRYPGKVLADEKSGRLFISDSNHNRIVIAKLDGTLIDTVGTGAIGAADGGFTRATFDHPQGMALKDEILYVADTEGHRLRKIDLKTKLVSTIAGTGKQGGGWPGLDAIADPNGPLPERWVGPPKFTKLNSPWALWIHKNDLFIAMAGSHQIWKMPLKESEIGPYAGNGREDIVDGPLLPKEPYQQGFASFAQPSGLTGDENWLYVADSEGSSIRALPMNGRGRVKTPIGTAGQPSARLFTFGDVDGSNQAVRLQHAMDVCLVDNLVYVADTYNNKVKVVDPSKKSSKTVAGNGKPGKEDDPAQFDEPTGLAYAAGKLYVADTNNHLVRTIDLKQGNKVRTLTILGLKAPAKPAAAKADAADGKKSP